MLLSVAPNTCFDEEKMMFRIEEMVLYRLKIKSKVTNVAEVNNEKVEGLSRHLWPLPEQSNLRTSMVAFPNGNSKGGLRVAIINLEFEWRIYMC